MKTLLLAVIFCCYANIGSAQTHSIIGAWYWSNSTKEMSIFLKKGGIVEIHSGKKGDAILADKLKVGKYTYEGNTLAITWKDNTSESYKIDFKDKDTFIIKNLGKMDATIKEKLTFNRVVDEEVITKP